ncbi:hypothetical protein VTI28DRAFT_6531 [Corynascus sepedonium]
MPLFLRPAREDDSVQIGWIGVKAFRDDVSRSAFPPHLHHKSKSGDPALDEVRWRAARNRKRMREGMPTYVVVDMPESEDSNGQVIGFIQWELPSLTRPPSADGNGKDEEDLSPPSLDQEQLHEISKLTHDMTSSALGADGYNLSSVAVDPSQHRRGIGRMLVRHGLDQAAKAGKDAFLIATEEGRGLYCVLGFHDVGKPVVRGRSVYYPMLWRVPSINPT